MEYIVVLLSIVTVAIIYYKNKTTYKSKPKAIKKEEIIKSYEDELKEILLSCKEDKSKAIELRIQFLKKVNQELSMNIFFEQNEARQILEKLSKME